MSRRLFAGIALDDATRSACARASEALRSTGFAAKYEGPDKFHITLAFLGNVDETHVEGIVAALRAAAALAAGFELTLDRLGAFPHERKPRVVYVGAREQGLAFRTLSAAVRKRYAALGFTFKDDGVAHVTIARVKEQRRALPMVEVVPATLRVNEIALFESIFDKEKNTSRYQVLERATLGR